MYDSRSRFPGFPGLQANSLPFPWHFSFFRKGADYGAIGSPKSSAGMDYSDYWKPTKSCFSGTSTVITRRGVIENAIRDRCSRVRQNVRSVENVPVPVGFWFGYENLTRNTFWI